MGSGGLFVQGSVEVIVHGYILNTPFTTLGQSEACDAFFFLHSTFHVYRTLLIYFLLWSAETGLRSAHLRFRLFPLHRATVHKNNSLLFSHSSSPWLLSPEKE